MRVGLFCGIPPYPRMSCEVLSFPIFPLDIRREPCYSNAFTATGGWSRGDDGAQPSP